MPKYNGSVRICGDYTVSVNDYNENKHPLARNKELFANLSGSNIFFNDI